MRGLEKNRMGWGHTYIQRTSRLYDRIGPVGRFDENKQDLLVSDQYNTFDTVFTTLCAFHIPEPVYVFEEEKNISCNFYDGFRGPPCVHTTVNICT